MATSTTADNPNKDLFIPEWINAEYFKNILQIDEPEFRKIIDISPVAAVPPGENFTSIIVRIFIRLELNDGSTKLKNYVLKTILQEDRGGRIIKELGFFPKEIQMYQKYIPEFERLYRKEGRNIQFAPRCVHTESRDGIMSLVFEDLKSKAYQNVDRLLGFDMQHMCRALQGLAEFHAASAVWYVRNGPYPEEFNKGFINGEDGREYQKRSFTIKMKTYKKALASWGLNDTEKYLNNLPTFEQYWNMALSILDTNPNEFNVLNHGDFWSSNIMLNYQSEGEIDQLLFVDYQLCKWGSPAQDLLFFITISAAKDIRTQEYDRFVEIYHKHLIECLNILKYEKPLPKLRDVHRAMYMENNTFYAFFAVYNHLPMVMFPSDKDSNINTLIYDNEIGEEFRMRVYSNATYAKVMLDLYPFYYQKGIFDFKHFHK